MRTIEELLGEVPVLQALAPEHRDTVAGCARNRVFEPGERIMREGDPADAFYVIREGQVALETVVPGRGAVVLQTLHDGELLGWSWLVPPYRTAFDARSIATTHAIAFDGACLHDRRRRDDPRREDRAAHVSEPGTHRAEPARLRPAARRARGRRAAPALRAGGPQLRPCISCATHFLRLQVDRA